MQSIRLEEWVSLMLPDAECQDGDRCISGVAIDSRHVCPGDLFFALQGEKTDGHAFLSQVAQSGGVAAVVSKGYQGESFGLSLVFVEDPLEALREAGRNKGRLFSGTIIGITGSVGKTTTKFFAQTLLSPLYKVFVSPRSYNSQRTVPLSILMADGDEDLLILEMGVSEPRNMKDLLAIVQPDIAVITHITEQHTLYFPGGGVDGIVEEKGHILHNSRIQLFSKDMPWYSHFDQQSSDAEKFTFSFCDRSADFYYLSLCGESVVIATPEGNVEVGVSFPYKPAYMNFLIAFALAWILRVPSHTLMRMGKEVRLPPTRFEQSERNGIQVINDAYNACPEAMLSALDAVPCSEKGRVILVLGHMAELGEYSEWGHSVVAEKALSKADMIFFIGEKWLPIQHLQVNRSCEVSFYSTAHDIAGVLKAVVRQGDVLFLKGSRALALESLLNCF